MNPDLTHARSVLDAGGYTCVLCRAETVYTSTNRGVAPLMDLLSRQVPLHGFSAADKVVGKATALLYCLLGVTAVYAHVISRPGLQVLEAHGIACQWEQLVDAIQNRTGDGFCPMETATRDISDPAQAPDAIRQALKALS